MPQPPRSLVEAPATVPALVAVVVLAVWAGSEGGYPAADWYPGAFLLLVLLGITVFVVPGRLRAVPRPALFGLVCLTGFTAWSYVSITWAGDRGEAWDGANRTFLYLALFALFALWPQRGRTATVVLGAWTLAIAGIELVELVRVAGAVDPSGFFIFSRLAEPAGYPNAAAATALMAFWPAVVLAGRPELAWWLRGAFGACAVLLADTALLTQSRGAMFTLPLLVVVFLVLSTARIRAVGVLLVVAAAVGATVPEVLHFAGAVSRGMSIASAVGPVVLVVVLATLAGGVLIAGAALLEGRRDFVRVHGERVSRAVAAAGIVALVALVVAFVAVTGNPLAQAQAGWRSFKQGAQVNQGRNGNRFVSGLGSARYDFYRVALNRFAARPLTGVGADNFAQDYLRDRRSDERARYPHSVELRALAQTGLVGALLLVAAFGGILAVALSARRRTGELGAATALGATMVFLDWLLHGSFDWFWEFAGLGGAAFAMAGLACSLAPRRMWHAPSQSDTADAPTTGEGGRPRSLIEGRGGAIGAGLAGAIAAASLLAPWLAERDVQLAARHWRSDPRLAFQALDQAAGVNRLSDRPFLVGGGIALRLGDLRLASRQFSQALARNPRGSYATLELGSIASQQGDRARALRLLGRAAALSPRDTIIREALRTARAGRRVDVDAINRQILERAIRLVR